MKVAYKLSAALGLLMVLMVTLLFYHVRTIRDLVSSGHELSEVSAQLALSSSSQLIRLTQLEENASKYGITRDRGYLVRFAEVLESYAATQDALAAMEVSGEERAALQELTRHWEAIRPAIFSFAAASATRTAAAEEQAIAELSAGLGQLRAETRSLAEVAQQAIRGRLASSAAAAREAERLSVAAAAAALLLSVIISVLIVRSITLALRRLRDGTHAVAGGNFGYRLPADRKDEFSELARDFNVMTERLEKLDQTKRDFLSQVSHDLKTPLASMQETNRILLDEVPGVLTQSQRRLLQLSDQSGRRLSSMIGDILDLSGLEAGAYRFSLETCALAPLVRAAGEQMEPILLERRVRISVLEPTEEIELRCDGERLVQVLVNLLENAVRFSPPDGEVRLEARLVGDAPAGVSAEAWRGVVERSRGSDVLLLSVADRGPGVPPEERERIFERFYQSQAGRRAWGRGVGLGLAIGREIVDAHGGLIWVDENPGGGSIFRVLLPGAVRQQVPPAERLAASN